MSQFCDTCRWLWPWYTPAIPSLLPLKGCTKPEFKKRPLPYQSESQRCSVEKTISSNLTDAPWAYPNYIWVSVTVTSPTESDISELSNCHRTLSLSGQSWILLVAVSYLHILLLVTMAARGRFWLIKLWKHAMKVRFGPIRTDRGGFVCRASAVQGLTVFQIQSTCLILQSFPIKRRLAVAHSKALAVDNGHLGWNSRQPLPKQKACNNYVGTQIHMLPTAHILSLSHPSPCATFRFDLN